MDLPAVIYQDDQILVLDKPPGLVVDESVTNKGVTLSQILTEQFGIRILRGGVVHRLDKDTSGLILAAKTEEALAKLQSQFKERVVKKEYTALVHGLIEKEGVIEGGIERNPRNRERFIVTAEGKEAVTGYKPIGNFKFEILNLKDIFSDYNKSQFQKLERQNYNHFTLVRCFPKTGRTHQLRVHLKHIGHPIVGDEKYAGRRISRLDHRFCPRQFLHASKIEFLHPLTEKEMVFESELAPDLKQVLKKLS